MRLTVRQVPLRRHHRLLPHHRQPILKPSPILHRVEVQHIVPIPLIRSRLGLRHPHLPPHLMEPHPEPHPNTPVLQPHPNLPHARHPPVFRRVNAPDLVPDRHHLKQPPPLHHPRSHLRRPRYPLVHPPYRPPELPPPRRSLKVLPRHIPAHVPDPTQLPPPARLSLAHAPQSTPSPSFPHQFYPVYPFSPLFLPPSPTPPLKISNLPLRVIAIPTRLPL